MSYLHFHIPAFMFYQNLYLRLVKIYYMQILPTGVSRGSFFVQKSVRVISQFIVLLILCSGSITTLAQSKKAGAGKNREYMALRVYHASSASQLAAIEQYLQNALLPAIEKKGFKKNGVFTAVDNDTAADKRLYVLFPLASLAQLEQLTMLSEKSLADSVKAGTYTHAAYNAPSFTRMETILLHAFSGMPQVKASGAGGLPADRIYELRSYESATEALHLNKVKMFNEGEVTLFERLGFNAVFYGQVIAGCRMPNLMYMTSFESKAARDEHWKAFGADAEWKKMSGLPQYQHNVSKIDIVFLKPVSFSRL